MKSHVENQRPLIGITADATPDKHQAGRSYSAMIVAAGGVPIILPCEEVCVHDFVALCDGFVFTGGDDPIMTHWDVPMHPKAKPVDPKRQAFELALLDGLAHDTVISKPVLGVCLGMQLMGLHAGGVLDQHLADHLPTADVHCGGLDKREHEIFGELGRGMVCSHHRQALTSAGSLSVVATAPDGVIEAIHDPHRSFYLGVQWHPERTKDRQLGVGLFERLIAAAAENARLSAISSR
jgi:putative glutamine amidotransferase